MDQNHMDQNRMDRRDVLRRGLAASAMLAFAAPQARAQQHFPDRPLKLIVPFPAGGPVDAVGREFAQKLGQVLGGRVVVIDKPGGQTSIAAAAVAHAAPDGYTLMLGGSPSHVFAPILVPDAPYDPIKDFTILSITGVETWSIIVPAKSPFKSLKDVAAFAKAHPGKLNYGNTAPSAELAVEMFKAQAGKLNIVAVPYRGFAPAILDLIGGRIQLMPSLIGAALGYYQQKAVRILAVYGKKRLPTLPDVPTAAEEGYPDLVLWTFSLVCTTAGVPAPIVARLSQATQKVLHDPAFIKFQEGRGIEPVLDSSPEAATKFLEQQIKLLTPAIRGLGRAG